MSPMIASGWLAAWVCLGQAPPAAQVGAIPVVIEQRVESLAGPVVLDTLEPRFSWAMRDADRGASQSAYSLLISSAREISEAGVGDVWDSGLVASARSIQVPYAGPTLAGSTRYWWRVLVLDDQGVRSAYGAPASFELGPLPGEWTASFVWDGTANPRNWCLLRKGFVLGESVARATLHVTAHDTFTLWVNGRLVGRGPAPADPYQGILYESFDVGQDLRPGRNAIAVVAHYHGASSGSGVAGEPAFLLQGWIELGGGQRIELVSDPSWKVRATTPWSESAPFRGPSFAQATCVEDYDARLEIPGWKAPDYDDSAWPNAVAVQRSYPLRAQRVPPVETERLVAPRSIRAPAPGVQVVDFGENLSGWPVLTVRGAAAGQRIGVWYSEELAAGRVVRDRDGISDYRDAYTARGDPAETWEPDTRYNGFRYLELEGLPGPLHPADVRLRWVHTPLRETGGFRCSSPLLEAIRENSVRTQKSCTQGVLVDCPQREQTQYAMDAYVQSLNLLASFENTDATRKWLQDLHASEAGTGVFLSRYPTSVIQVIPEWSLHWVFGLWLHYLHFGDERVLADAYPAARRLLSTLGSYRDPTTGLLKDVPAPSYTFYGLEESMSVRTPLNCFYHGALLVMADIARELGQNAEALASEAAADAVRRAINRYLFDRTAYRDGLGSTARHEFANVLPVAMGVARGAMQRRALKLAMSRGFESGPVEGYYLLDTLFERGQADYALSLLEDPTQRWGGQVSVGETTTWESWDPDYSRSHGWAAYPLAVLSRNVLGVAPTAPGFARFRVRPGVGGSLTWAEGEVPTIRGKIEVRWQRVTGGLQLELAVPVGSSAELHLPTFGRSKARVWEGGTLIVENGRPAGSVAGVTFLRNERGFVFDVAAGSYAFELASSGLASR